MNTIEENERIKRVRNIVSRQPCRECVEIYYGGNPRSHDRPTRFPAFNDYGIGMYIHIILLLYQSKL